MESDFEVSLVSPRNYFLFTPLLPGLTTGTLNDRTIVTSIRHLIKKVKPQISYYEASCTSIDPEAQQVECQDISGIQGSVSKFKLPYDYLVMAVGSQPATFGTPGVRQYAHFLKTVEDAQAIRSKIIDCFESANIPGQPDSEKKRLLSFVVVGGGPTGCEFAGELHDLIEKDVRKYYAHLLPYVSVHLVQSQDKVLNTFDKKISEFVEKKFSRDHITLHTDSRVKEVKPNELVVYEKKNGSDITLPFGLCVWSTGIEPIPLVKQVRDSLKDKGQTNTRALVVDDNLQVKGAKNIFAIGDCSTIERKHLKEHLGEMFQQADVDGNGELSWKEFHHFLDTVSKKYPQLEVYNGRVLEIFKEMDVDKSGSLSHEEFKHLLEKADSEVTVLPSTAQVASQQGQYLATLLNTLAKDPKADISATPFRYHHRGSFASIGGSEAVGEVPGMLEGGGFQVWLMWRGIYLSKQFSITNKVLLSFDWVRTTLFGRDVSRF
uniref:EF-hand domain-containing protein n=1 Tax=Arcella intermedia TaxID=1963864 RepID=A0A6B2L1N3_9EUKA